MHIKQQLDQTENTTQQSDHHIQKKNKDEIEKVQRRAARFVRGRYHNTSSVSSMIDHLHWESLEQRRQKARVIMLYKIIHNEVDINPQSYLKKQERTTRSAHPYQFQTYSPTTDYFKYWNSLPNSMVVSGQSLDQFKTLIQGYKF